MSQNLVGLTIEGGRLSAIAAATSGDRVRFRSWLDSPVPSDVDARDPAALGAWVARELERGGLPAGRVVIGVPRSEVVLKRLRFPRAAAGTESDLAGMVRLQMARQLTMAIEGTAIDYVRLSDEGDNPSTPISILAAALPADRLAFYTTMARAAKCKIDRIGLRAAGLAGLLGPLSQQHAGPVLAIGVGASAIEFVVVEDGKLVFARAAESPPIDGTDSLVQRAAVEAKRTWMSYRVGEDAAEVDAVVIPGVGELSEQLGRTCGEALEMPWKSAPLPTHVELPPQMPEAERLLLAPLVGLVAERTTTFDFAHPRRAPDLGAKRRQAVLASLLALILLGGVGYLVATRELSSLRSRLQAANEKLGGLRKEYAAFLLEDARAAHLARWSAADPDWIAHLRAIADRLPNPKDATLDQISGRLASAVVFEPVQGQYDRAGWKANGTVTFSLPGRMKDRDVANDLRLRLIASGAYQLDSSGADEPDRFSFELTGPAQPPAASPKPAPAPAMPATPTPTAPGTAGERGAR
ncbi:MAG: pilus assembly protein PilM [Phycisphaerae bacterium]|nr:pilus assembly protein PilM [Phycisphaerae bacterium]